jgi:TonB family protein
MAKTAIPAMLLLYLPEALAAEHCTSRHLEPILSTHTVPDWPLGEQRVFAQGVVHLRITIGQNGRVTSARVTKSTGFASLDDASLEGVKQYWRWKPWLGPCAIAHVSLDWRQTYKGPPKRRPGQSDQARRR